MIIWTIRIQINLITVNSVEFYVNKRALTALQILPWHMHFKESDSKVESLKISLINLRRSQCTLIWNGLQRQIRFLLGGEGFHKEALKSWKLERKFEAYPILLLNAFSVTHWQYSQPFKPPVDFKNVLIFSWRRCIQMRPAQINHIWSQT